jgi:hypothetical protein
VYEPKPLATSRVELAPELYGLADRLAEHQHAVWARERMAEGWTFGPERDEARKLHPGLIPYAELPEQEKERLRSFVLEVVRALSSLGFAIAPSGREGDAILRGGESAAAPLFADLPDARQQAERSLGTGEPLQAYETIEAALSRWPDDLRLRQLRGLALARSGAAERANQTMLRLLAQGHGDGETLGILARTHKDLAARATTSAARADQLEQAFLVYHQGYEAALRRGEPEDAYFTGINAATLSLLTGEKERAATLAHEVRALCRSELGRSQDASYWLHATLAEAALLLGERGEAEEHYGQAAARAGTRYGDLSTTRRQARLVLAERGEDAGWLEEVLRVPPIALFTGHMIDRPGRAEPRFPAELEGVVGQAIRDRLRRLRPAAGYASAACGGDILFLEALLAEKCEFHIVLPFPTAGFLRASVDVVPGSDWPQRFHRILEAAASVTSASDHASEDPSTFVYTNLILSGMAALHARRLETQLAALAVWDGKPAVGAGGTASLVEHWQSRGLTLEHIDLGGLARGEKGAEMRTEPETSSPAGKDATEGVRDELMAMLFADAVGYSRLNEDQTRLFVAHFLSPIAELIEASPHPPVLRETAGDGFYFVFEHTRDAGLFAVALQDLVARLDWEARGLPATLGLRVGLHCGPVQRVIDPITRLPKYTGPHTSRTARIEPITPPGQVYASQAFAAVAAATGVEELVFEYVGQTALAKKYGSLPLYHVRRA